MNTILTLAKLTFREAVRRKIVISALLLGVAFLIIYGLGIHYIGQEFQHQAQLRPNFPRQAMMTTQAYNVLALAGMYVVNFLCIAIAALITADTLAGEIQSGTIQAVMTKPVRRSEIVLGKWLGNAGLLMLYLLFMGGGVILMVRLQTGYAIPNWFGGLVMVYFNCLTIMTLALAFSSRLSTLATGGAVFGAFGLAFIGGWVERIGSFLNNETATNLGILSSLLLPSEALWNKASSLMASPLINMVGVNPFSGASEPSTLMLVYAGVYLLASLAIAAWQFSRRDL